MAYCRNCGAEIDEKAVMCPSCWAPQQSNKYSKYSKENRDSGTVWYAILSFIFPIVGAILFVTWNDSRPKVANVAGISALVSFIILSILNSVY